MDKKEFKKVIETGLEGKWILQYDKPTQWLHFFKPPSENDLGKLIMANSVDFVENRQRLEYEVLINDDLTQAYLNIYVKTSNQTIQYLINNLNSPIGNLWLDDANGHYHHYHKLQSQT